MPSIDKPYFEQLRAWLTPNSSLSASQSLGKLKGILPYWRAMASLNSSGLRSKWLLLEGITDNQAEHFWFSFLTRLLLRLSSKLSIKANVSLCSCFSNNSFSLAPFLREASWREISRRVPVVIVWVRNEVAIFETVNWLDAVLTGSWIPSPR